MSTQFNSNVFTNQVTCPGGTVYTIRAGDTLFNLASRFNTTVQAIINANPGIDPNNLQVGQRICIPVAPGPGDCPGGFMYTIRAGDTFFTIANRFNISVDALVQANPGVDPDRLQIGQQICVPTAPGPGLCPGGFLYTIRAGDTFFSLAARFNVSVQALISANPGVDPNRLMIGQQICIPTAPPAECPGGFMYTIRAGDTFFGLAARFNVTVQQLINANPGVDPNRLEIGQQICIPTQAPGPGPCPGGFLYTIRAGDTFFGLAARFNVTVQQLAAANPGVDPNRLMIGQQICIPTAPPVECPNGRLYTIRAGDTLFALAQRFGTTVAAILAANPGLDPNSLQVGRMICIPNQA